MTIVSPQALDQIVDEVAERIAMRVVAELACQIPANSGSVNGHDWCLWDVEEVARRLGRSVRWVRERVRRGDLPQVRLDGGPLAFDPADVKAFARARRIPLEDDATFEPGSRLRVAGE